MISNFIDLVILKYLIIIVTLLITVFLIKYKSLIITVFLIKIIIYDKVLSIIP